MTLLAESLNKDQTCSASTAQDDRPSSRKASWGDEPQAHRHQHTGRGWEHEAIGNAGRKVATNIDAWIDAWFGPEQWGTYNASTHAASGPVAEASHMGGVMLGLDTQTPEP